MWSLERILALASSLTSNDWVEGLVEAADLAGWTVEEIEDLIDDINRGLDAI